MRVFFLVVNLLTIIVISSSDSSDSNENNGSDNNDNEVNYYGSQIGSDGPPPVIDAERTQASDPRKLPISDSSDEASDPSPLWRYIPAKNQVVLSTFKF